MDDGMECRRTFFSSDSKRSLVIEDDGKVAYAYMCDEGDQIIGDVWLFNRGDAPKEPEWRDRTKAPFANPADYVLEVQFSPPIDLNEFSIVWEMGERYVAKIFLRNKIFATLADNEKPGKAILAKKNGPLAGVLSIESGIDE